MKTASKTFFALVTALAVLTACNNDDDSPGVPEVTTIAVTEITSDEAQSGGNVTADGGAPVISRGVVWSNLPAPDMESQLGLRVEGGGLGTFSSAVTGLGEGRTYYMRAFAVNAAGTAYGQQVEFSTPSDAPPAYPSGTVHCIENGAEVVEVYSPLSGQIWMDRNLGASRVATASDDGAAYGDLYQWGRFSDGHQCRYSGTTDVIADGPSPGHGDYIVSNSSNNFDWLSPQDDNLWQGVNGTNNPCPEGFRIPTDAEWRLEGFEGWSFAGRAFNSALKLPAAGMGNSLDGAGLIGYYHSSTVDGIRTRAFYIRQNAAGGPVNGRFVGGSVRCIKD